MSFDSPRTSNECGLGGCSTDPVLGDADVLRSEFCSLQNGTGGLNSKLRLHPKAVLEPLQKAMLAQFVEAIDPEAASLVITNPLLKDNPIVYVTEPWQKMCGFTYAEAVGKNPRVTQGERTDPRVIEVMSGALSSRSSCKVQLVNYRSGLLDRPFWNMLSISPLMFRGEVKLFIANLQDYSYHMTKMLSLTPAQFCKAAEYFQRVRPIAQDVTMHMLAKPTCYEVDVDHVKSSAVEQPVRMAPPLKRLGWSKLRLEPEYLTDRVVDALMSIDAEYDVKLTEDRCGEMAVVCARMGAVSFRVVVDEDPSGSYRITCSRLSGDTFEYHAAYRSLRQHLQDAVGAEEPRGRGHKRQIEGTTEAGRFAPMPRTDERAPALRGSLGLAPLAQIRTSSASIPPSVDEAQTAVAIEGQADVSASSATGGERR
uniref:PAS domain-containing protein n=1 Tax=Coccolithus braarudii TaxID=221442 RepID=A0A7S0LAH5_9EUKA